MRRNSKRKAKAAGNDQIMGGKADNAEERTGRTAKVEAPDPQTGL